MGASLSTVRRMEKGDARVPIHFLARALHVFGEIQALAVLGEVHAAVSDWRRVALGPGVGLRPTELDDFAPAFEHEQMTATAGLLGQ